MGNELGKPWPNVVLNVKTKENFRPDVQGPLSIFVNLKGSSLCRINGHSKILSGNTYFLSNKDQFYTLEYESFDVIETFNIHFGDKLVASVYSDLTSQEDFLFNEGQRIRAQQVAMYNRLYELDSETLEIIHYLHREQETLKRDELALEECLIQLLYILLKKHRNETNKVNLLLGQKPGTKLEIYKRLSLAVDYMYSYMDQPVNLSILSEVSCLSKFHFLRLFKQLYGLSPHRYLNQIRISRASQHLRNSSLPITDIAFMSGFADLSTFSKTFRKMKGLSPLQFRNSNF